MCVCGVGRDGNGDCGGVGVMPFWGFAFCILVEAGRLKMRWNGWAMIIL